MDFQTREPVSPVIAAMPATRLAVEMQVDPGVHGPAAARVLPRPVWSEVLGFAPWGPGGPPTSRDRVAPAAAWSRSSNAGDDPFWTGHPLAQANLYAFGRLAWDPPLDPSAILDEWIDADLRPRATADPARLRRRCTQIWTAPGGRTSGTPRRSASASWCSPDTTTARRGRLRVQPWGTYHFADRDGVGVDRSRATGTGFAGQYRRAVGGGDESPETCPDELLLFFHHVPYGHVLHSGDTVIQHIYDTHFAGVEEVAGCAGCGPGSRT